MATLKGKLGSGVAEDSLAKRKGARGFKVFVENVKKSAAMDNTKTRSKEDPLTIAANPKVKGTMKNTVKRDGKHGISVGPNIQRRALADVSNFTSNAMRIAVIDGSKSQMSTNRVSRTGNCSTTKSLKGKGKDLSNQGSSRDVSVSMGIKILQPKNSGSDDSRAKRMPTVLTRKSLPVLKRESLVNRTDKEMDQGSTKVKRTSGISVGANHMKVIPPVSNAKRYLLRNRGSDGFAMTSRFRNNSHAPSLPRRSVKPVVKTTTRASNTGRPSKSKTSSVANNPVVDTVSSSKGNGDTGNVQHSLSKDANQKEDTSIGFNQTNVNPSEVVAVEKSKRRKSYTSLLMARSKLLEKHGEAKDDAKLPSIDNDGNQLEVAQYVDEIYQYYWVTEAQSSFPENYMTLQTEITPRMRGILVNWLIEVHFKYDLMPETLYLMVTILDKYLSQVQIKKSEMQLAGLASLLLASKYEDYWHPKIKELLCISAESYTRKQLLGMEKLFLKKLKFRLNMPTPYVFMLRFLKAAQSDVKLEHLAFYLVELCLVEYEALNFKPSLLCASAIYVARCTLQLTPTWTPLLCRHSRYDMFQIRDCSNMILRFHRSASTAQLNVTYGKYLKPDLSCVAAIEPLDQLPK